MRVTITTILACCVCCAQLEPAAALTKDDIAEDYASDMGSDLKAVAKDVVVQVLSKYMDDVSSLTSEEFGVIAHDIRKGMGEMGKNGTIRFPYLYWQVIVGRYFVNVGKRLKGSALHFHVGDGSDAIHGTIYNK